MVLKCRGCGKTPDQIDEYVIEAAREGIDESRPRKGRSKTGCSGARPATSFGEPLRRKR